MKNQSLRSVLPNLCLNLACLIASGWENFEFLGQLSLKLMYEMKGLVPLVKKYIKFKNNTIVKAARENKNVTVTVKVHFDEEENDDMKYELAKFKDKKKGFTLDGFMANITKRINSNNDDNDIDLIDNNDELKDDGKDDDEDEKESSTHLSTIIQSPHPYPESQNTYKYKVELPLNVKFIVLTFDERCQTQVDGDKLELFVGKNFEDKVYETYSQKRWPEVIMIPGNELLIVFTTMSPRGGQKSDGDDIELMDDVKN